MRLLYVIALVFLFAKQLSFSAELFDDQYHWVSASAIWGQGGVGIGFSKDETSFVGYDNFVWDWDEKEITYNELGIYIDKSSRRLGYRIRTQNSKNEISPFIGMGLPQLAIEDFSFHNYNEIEYRVNPNEIENDYFRGNLNFRISYLQGVIGERLIKPYVALSYYFDASEFSFEKYRVYLGYSVSLKKIDFGAYIIPHFEGTAGGEWDDNKKFGAYIRIKI